MQTVARTARVKRQLAGIFEESTPSVGTPRHRTGAKRSPSPDGLAGLSGKAANITPSGSTSEPRDPRRQNQKSHDPRAAPEISMRQQTPASHQLGNWSQHTYKVWLGVGNRGRQCADPDSRFDRIDQAEHATPTWTPPLVVQAAESSALYAFPM